MRANGSRWRAGVAAGVGAAIGTAVIVGVRRSARVIGLVIAADAKPAGDGPRHDKKQEKNEKKKKGDYAPEGSKKARKGK